MVVGTGQRSSRRSRDTISHLRTGKACDTCRQKKEKCDGVTPSCGTCRKLSRSCQYAHNTKRRGLPEGWVRSLEKIWAIALTLEPSLDDRVCEVLQAGLSNPEASDFAALWTDETSSDGLFQKWRASRIPEQLDGSLPQLEALPKQKLSDIPNYSVLRPERHTAVPDAASAVLDGISTSMIDPVERSSNAPADQVIPSQEEQISLSEQGLLMHLPQQGRNLLDAYFADTHVWFPVVEKHRVYRAWHTISQGQAANNSDDAACLYSVLAYSATLKHDLRASVGHMDRVAEAMASRARLLVPHKADECKPAHLQALLILCLLKLLVLGVEEAWIEMSEIIARIQLLCRRTASMLMKDTQGIARAFSGCLVLDTVLSLAVRQRPRLHGAEIEKETHIDEDCMEEWEHCTHPDTVSKPGFILSSFNRLVEYSAAINRHMSEPHLAPSVEIVQLRDAQTVDQQPSGIDPSVDAVPMMAHQATLRLFSLVIDYQQNLISDQVGSILGMISQFLKDNSQRARLTSAHTIWEPVVSYLYHSTNEQFEATSGEVQQFESGLRKFLLSGPQHRNHYKLPISSTTDATGLNGNLSDPHPGAHGDALPTSDTPEQARAFEMAQSGATGRDTAPGSSQENTTADYSDSGTIRELIALDALNWDDSWQQSFQGLGFPPGQRLDDDMFLGEAGFWHNDPG